MNTKLTISSSVLAILAIAFIGHSAAAEEEFDLVAKNSEIALVTKGHWHVNKDYPWKVVAGSGETFDKSHFVFTETSAKLSGVPHGNAQLKGAVCDGPHCLPFTKRIEVE
jgi:hypothetical protein